MEYRQLKPHQDQMAISGVAAHHSHKRTHILATVPEKT